MISYDNYYSPNAFKSFPSNKPRISAVMDRQTNQFNAIYRREKEKKLLQINIAGKEGCCIIYLCLITRGEIPQGIVSSYIIWSCYLDLAQNCLRVPLMQA